MEYNADGTMKMKERSVQQPTRSAPAVEPKTVLQSTLEAHAASGEEGLLITVVHKGKVFGVTMDPACLEDFNKREFKDFAEQYLEPAFNQLAQLYEVQQ